jgi:predicted MFS family arabinose efflux permease
VGIPVLAIVVSLASWRMGYAGAALLCAALLFVVRARLDHDPPHVTVGDTEARARLTSRSVAPVLMGFGMLMTANFFVIVVFGVWLEDAFGLSSTQIGIVSFVLGGAELMASTSAFRMTDRWGKRRSITLGASLMIPTALAMGLLHGQTIIGVLLLFGFVLGFEFALVSSLPLIGELQPNARATTVGYALGLGTVGRGVASIFSTRIYTSHGIGGSAVTAAVCALVTVALFGFAHEPGARPDLAD